MTFSRFVCTSLLLALACSFPSSLISAYASDSVRPVTPCAQRLCESLEKPEMEQQLEMAEKLHLEQASLLEDLASSPADARQIYLSAVVLALDEYCALELSYPQYAASLVGSGCLLNAWSEGGFTLLDYSYDSVSLTDHELYYIPQPIGLATLRSMPGRGCTFKRRCFDEYCLATVQDHKAVWTGRKELPQTDWMSPFNMLGIIELVHTTNAEPFEMSCDL